MSRTQRSSPVPKFLEVSADADAFDLLGLLPAECTAPRVEAALQRQLDRVAAHPEGDTPEADEVRLALHSGAAQLLDAELRRTVIEARAENRAAQQATREAESSSAQPASAGREEVVPRAAPAPRSDYFRSRERDSNATVKKVLLIGGSVALLVVGGVIGLMLLTPPTAAPPAPMGSSSTAPPAASQSPASAASSSTAPTEASRATRPEGTPGDAAAKPNPKAAKRTEFAEAAVVIRDLRAAAARARNDAPAALESFRGSLAQLADWWPRYEIGQRRAADDAVMEFLYVVNERPEMRSALEELAVRARLPAPETGQLSPDAVWPSAWATGTLMRLSAERGLPRSLAAGVAQSLNDALGAGRGAAAQTFEGGAEAALRRMPLRLVAPRSPAQVDAEPAAPRAGAEAMKRWADALAAVGSGDSAEYERLLVDGLEQILLNATEPDTDQATFEAVEILATRIKWRSGGPARQRLLDWFNDSRVSAADLRVLTSVLAGKSNAEGVDATMQLSVNATPDDRAQLRAQYAQAWGLIKGEQREKAYQQWRWIAQGGVSLPTQSDDLEQVAGVVMTVRINQAARKLWLGDPVACTQILADVERIPTLIRDIGFTAGKPTATIPGVMPPPGPNPNAPPPPPNPHGPTGKTPAQLAPVAPPGEGPWGEQYLKAERNIPVRLQRLAEAEQLQSPLTKLDASVLAETACLGSPGQVRLAAQRVVMKFADDPAIVQAMLDELPNAPKVQNVAETVARVAHVPLPKVGDPEWELAARRALVDRLLGLLAGQGPQAGIDQACNMIGEAYVSMAGADSGSLEESAAERCVRGATQLYKLWRMEADRLPPPEQAPGTLDQLERRRRSRQQIASGPVQAFAGEQVSIAELLAYIVCAERPAQATRALAALDEMARTRREASHIFAQMTATERTISRLWMLRFGEVAP